MSHLLQMRGLKHLSLNRKHHRHVASFTDAWIETYKKLGLISRLTVASFTDAWIETFYPSQALVNSGRSHLLQMRGLKLHSKALPLL